MNFPIISVTLEGMRETVRHAFSQQAINMSAELDRALQRECTPEKIQKYVDSASREVVETSVRDAVKRWWLTSESGQALIREAVASKMDEEAEFYKKEWKK